MTTPETDVGTPLVRSMQQVQINIGTDGPEIHVRETETPGTWGLMWTGVLDSKQARRMLRAAEDIVLSRGGERISLRCGEDEEALRDRLDRYPPDSVSKDGARYTVDLIVPGKDGFVHDDYDFRTPLNRVTCPTCVKRFIESRTERREEILKTRPGSQVVAEYTRLVAEAYTRLAEIEETLDWPEHTKTT